MIGLKNGTSRGVSLFRPIDGRPDLIVVQLKDGRKTFFGDGNPLSTDEFLKVQGGVVELTTPKLKFTEAEQSELDAVADLRERSRRAVDSIYDAMEGIRAKIESQYMGGGWLGGDSPDESVVRDLEQEMRRLNGGLAEALEIEKTTLREFNTTNARISKQAYSRQRPVKFHNPPQSTEERLDNLEDRNV